MTVKYVPVEEIDQELDRRSAEMDRAWEEDREPEIDAEFIFPDFLRPKDGETDPDSDEN